MSTPYHVPHPTDPDGIALHDPRARPLSIDDATPRELVERAEAAAAAYLAATDIREARHAAALAYAFREFGAGECLTVYADAIDRARVVPARPGADRHTIAKLERRAAAAIHAARKALRR